MGTNSELTAVLLCARRGDPDAGARLLTAVYEELRRMAGAFIAREAPGATLRPTDLVHEAYLRLFPDGQAADWAGRAHFFGAAAEAMRRILVEHARSRGRLKRGGGMHRIDLEQVDIAMDSDPGDVLVLDAAISRLEAIDPRAAEIVKLRCYVGMTIAEAATALGITSRTVNRDWLAAKAWLKGELLRRGGNGESREDACDGA